MQDLGDRLSFVTDPEAPPADLDRALAQFLLAYVRNTDGTKDEKKGDAPTPTQ